MTRRRRALAACVAALATSVLATSVLAGCTIPPSAPLGGDAGMACESLPDRDGDGVPDALEPYDTDLDGTMDRDELDADDDGATDREEAGDAPCLALPDRDEDGTPDVRDPDGNGDTVPDREQRGSDLDGDDVLDALDLDTDGDGIANVVEQDADEPVDTDGDGTVDALDRDSDADAIDDLHEGAGDLDGDAIGSFRDPDADGDGADDLDEAGDDRLDTLPVACPHEIDLVTGEPADDGRPDALDRDRDGDGALDGDELARGLDPCDADTDGDGFLDVVEIARDRLECLAGTEQACGCAADPECGIPGDDYYVILPHGAEVERTLEVSTSLRAADVFLLADTTGSMGITLERIQDTATRPGDGLLDRVRAQVPSAWLGGGSHDDFPLHWYGSADDQVFTLAIPMSPPEDGAAVSAAFAAIPLHIGGDYPESATEALFQVATGRGGTWTARGDFYSVRRHLEDCSGGRWGAACFRPNALPIVVHFTDACSHQGPPGESSDCLDYDGLSPAPASWTQMVDALRDRAVRYVGINAGAWHCEGSSEPDRTSPCFFLHETARATGTVDLEGDALVLDMPQDATSEAEFVETVTGAITTVATRIPFDVDTAVRAGPASRADVDPVAFVGARRPACTAPASDCWVAPAGVAHEDAVGSLADDGFLDVVPGTELTFALELRNDVFEGGDEPEIFVAFVDVRGDRVTTLDTRAVYVVVPAADGPG